MNPLNIEIRENQSVFAPGETLEGRASWFTEKTPKKAVIRLFWHTQGKGTEDLEVVEEIAFDSPKQQDSRSFSLTLPHKPYSFSGSLVSLVWGLELVVKGHKKAFGKEIIISPFEREIRIQ